MKPLPLLCGIALLAAACSGPTGRPVSEALTPEQNNRLLKQDPAYGYTITFAEQFRQKAPATDLARASELTYARLNDFLTEYLDEAFVRGLRAEGEGEWLAEYGSDNDKADSIEAAWRRFLEENKPESYVRVDLAAILPDQSTYGTARILLEVRPLRGPLEQVEGAFGLFERDGEYTVDDGTGFNRFSLDKGLAGPTKVPAWLTYNVWRITDGDIPYNMYPDRPGLPLDKLKQKYKFDYAVTSLVKDGRRIRNVDLLEQVPDAVRSYWRAKDKDGEREYAYSRMVCELVNPQYVSCTEYVRNYADAYFRQKDALAAWLVSAL